MLTLTLLVTCTILNRIRGLTYDWVPGRNLYFCAPILGALAWLWTSEWSIGLAFAFAYLVWGSWPWGRFVTLGRLPFEYARQGVPIKPYEKAVLAIGGENPQARLMAGDGIALFPGFVAIALVSHGWLLLLWPAMTIAITIAFEFGWQAFPTKPDYPVIVGQMMTGLLWGVLILLA